MRGGATKVRWRRQERDHFAGRLAAKGERERDLTKRERERERGDIALSRVGLLAAAQNLFKRAAQNLLKRAAQNIFKRASKTG
ncbi:hypothetical protein FCM35_KLT16034 [Carex littledalei]|uniref:Uncharacterized protein n=1 Tax=Carex littledalei TaxID=544730 RepID=A0A833RI10_9POAL|nr:hypothetical protein FCM35_KLT16034 [Carex littledalei]